MADKLEKKKAAPIQQQDRTAARADFVQPDFDNLVQQKGNTFLHQKATICPCRTEENGNPDPHCVSCEGNGWIYGSRTKVRGVIQSVSFDPKHFEYSRANLGIAMFTCMERIRLAWFDRLKFTDGESTFSESVFVRADMNEGALKGYLTYEPLAVQHVYLYIDNSTPFVQLDITDYTITGKTLEIIGGAYTESSYQLSIRYEHNPVYVVMDINKDIRSTPELQSNQSEKRLSMPMYATLKKLHYIDGDS